MSRAAAFQFLCGCLSRDVSPAAQAALTRSAQNPSFAWETFVQVAAETQVAPSVLAVLHSRDLVKALPADAIDFFDGLAVLNRQRNEQLISEATALAATLNEIGVVPVFLKGAAHLLAGLYPDLAQRVMVDLDVLVPADRLSDCVDQLTTDGFEQLLPDWDISGQRHHRPLGRPDRIGVVELHSELVDAPYRRLLPAAEVSRGAVTLTRGGVKLAVPSGRVRMVHAVAHAQLADRAYLYGHLTLRDLIDFARLHQAFGHDIDWSDVMQRFAADRVATALEFHLLAAERLLGVPIEPPIRISQRTRVLYWRALWHMGHPGWARFNARLLRPWLLLRRSLSDAVLRRRLARSLGDRTWLQRQWRTFWQ